MSVGYKIKTMRKKHGLTQKDLAKKLGLAATAVSAWERDANNPMMDSLSRMSELFDVPISYFYSKNLSDVVSESNSNQYRLNAKNLIQASPATVRVPVLGSISCGDPLLVEENIKEYRYESPDMLPSGECYYLEANGDSMEPAIPNGSLVLIRFQPEVESGEIAAVLLNGNEEATLKRVRKQGGNIILYPENNNYEPIFVDADNPAKIIGKAISVKYNL